MWRARFRCVEHAVEVGERAFGPVVLARERLIAEGPWDELRAAVSPHHARWAKPVDGGIEIEMDYVAIIGEKPARSSL
jgi:hypothetical protein